jgi:uncharacterized protein YjbI with pentapeptide repeats
MTQEISVNQLFNGEIDLNSLSDEEAIKLHEEVAIYLVNNELKIDGKAVNIDLVKDSLKPLWMRTWRNLDNSHFKELFEKLNHAGISITYVIPYVYITLSIELGEGDILCSIFNWDKYKISCNEDSSETEMEVDKWIKSGVFDFLVRTIDCLQEEIWNNWFKLSLDNVLSPVASLGYDVIDAMQLAKEQNRQELLTELDCLSWRLITVLQNIISDLNIYKFEDTILSDLLNSYKDVFGNEAFQEILTEQNLSDADLRNADFNDADLTGVDLSGSDLSYAQLIDANLSDADLTRTNLSDADLTRTNLRGANLRGANLSDADLTDANLSGANLSDADLTDANLSGANLSGADLTDANLSGANLEGIITDENTKIEIPEE